MLNKGPYMLEAVRTLNDEEVGVAAGFSATSPGADAH